VGQRLRHLWAYKTLRSLASATTLQGAGTWMMMAVLVLYSLETLQAPAAAYGLLITAYAAGSLFGAGISAKLEVLLGTRWALSVSALAAGQSVLMLAFCRAFVLAAAAMAVLGVGSMILNVVTITLRQRRTPEAFRGRVSSAFSVLNVSSAPVVAPLSGLIASSWGVPAALFTAVLCLPRRTRFAIRC
jgi:MFS family permease